MRKTWFVTNLGYMTSSGQDLFYLDGMHVCGKKLEQNIAIGDWVEVLIAFRTFEHQSKHCYLISVHDHFYFT